MYLETPSVQVIQPADDSAVAMARQVMRLLIGGSGWVRVHSSATGLSPRPGPRLQSLKGAQ